MRFSPEILNLLINSILNGCTTFQYTVILEFTQPFSYCQTIQLFLDFFPPVINKTWALSKV